MKQLPTADILNFLIEEISGNEKQHDITHNGYGITMFTRQAIKEVAIEFAKLHVQAALESGAENAKIKTEYYHEEDVGRTRLREILNSSDLASERTDGDGIMYAVDTYEVNKQSILNAYSLDNIK